MVFCDYFVVLRISVEIDDELGDWAMDEIHHQLDWKTWRK